MTKLLLKFSCVDIPDELTIEVHSLRSKWARLLYFFEKSFSRIPRV